MAGCMRKICGGERKLGESFKNRFVQVASSRWRRYAEILEAIACKCLVPVEPVASSRWQRQRDAQRLEDGACRCGMQVASCQPLAEGCMEVERKRLQMLDGSCLQDLAKRCTEVGRKLLHMLDASCLQPLAE